MGRLMPSKVRVCESGLNGNRKTRVTAYKSGTQTIVINECSGTANLNDLDYLHATCYFWLVLESPRLMFVSSQSVH